MLKERLNDLSDLAAENKIAKLFSCEEDIRDFTVKTCMEKIVRKVYEVIN